MAEEPELVWLDPDSEECYERMAGVIEEEISVRLALRDADVNDPEWGHRIASLAADELLNCFVVRPRTVDTPRNRWVSH